MDEKKEEKNVTCPLCGFLFDALDEQACKACNKKANCLMVVCPNCYHEFFPPARTNDGKN